MFSLYAWEIPRCGVIHSDLVFLEFNRHKTKKQRIVYFWVQDNFDIFCHLLVKTSILSACGHYNNILYYILWYIFKQFLTFLYCIILFSYTYCCHVFAFFKNCFAANGRSQLAKHISMRARRRGAPLVCCSVYQFIYMHDVITQYCM